MKPRLNKEEVQRWLAGQMETEKVIRRERMRWLENLTQEEALEVYLSLPHGFGAQRDLTKPSYVLTAMRRVLDLQARKKQADP